MAGLEELKKKVAPLFNPEEGPPDEVSMDSCESYVVSDHRTVNLMSESCGVYNINELGLQKRTADFGCGTSEKTFRCASHEMHVFGTIGTGASSVVQRAIKIPIHRILALKKIHVFEKEKRQQILNEIRTLCEAPCYPGLVEFHGAFYTPDSGHISIALEYMDGGSLADVLQIQKPLPEPILACMLLRLLHGLSYLHGVRHLVHRDIKPANLLINLKGDTKITDFGISSGLESSIAMCATFIGTVTYMSPERIRNERYSYSADIWSLGLSTLELATCKFPYSVNEGSANLMLQILYDPPPRAPRESLSPEFCSFIDVCLQTDPTTRPTAEQLLSHPFIMKYSDTGIDLQAYARSIFDPEKRLKEIADMLAVHYYLLFDGSNELWHHARTFYARESTLRVSGKCYSGQDEVYDALSDLRRALGGRRPQEKIVHVVEKLHCRLNSEDGVVIRASGFFVLGNNFLICGDGVQAEGMLSIQEVSTDVFNKQVGTFYDQFVMEPGAGNGCFSIVSQDMHIVQLS